MKKSVQVVIKNMELRNFCFKNEEASVDEEVAEVGLETKLIQEIKKENKTEHHVEITGEFDVRFGTNTITANYILTIIFMNFKEKLSIEEFLEQEKYSLAYPILSKMSALVARISGENMPFPLIIPIEDWEDDNDNLED